MDFGSVLTRWPTEQAWPEDAERDRLLDAARTEFIAHGFRRAAVADIARRANVSRQTLHRRCGDKDDMVSAVITREVLTFFERLSEAFDADMPIEEQMVELFVIGVRECRTNPVVGAIQEFETDLLSPGVFDNERGSAVTAAVATRLIAESFPVEGARQATELIFRITATLLLSPSEALRTGTDEEARRFARTYFIPILDAARTVT